MLTKELEQELRAAINPAYADVRGTESYERKILLGEIGRLRELIADQIEEIELKQACIQGMSKNTDCLGKALQNCRLLAAKNRSAEWAKHIFRFCEEAGLRASPLRGGEPELNHGHD